MSVSQSRALRLVLVVVVLVAGVGVVTAHGTFSVRLLVEERAIQDDPEQFRFNVTSGGADEVPERFGSEAFAVNYTVLVEGRPIDEGGFTLGTLDHRVVTVTHAFDGSGFREVAVNVTYSLGDGEWTERRRSTRLVEVVEPGTGAAAEECSAEAGGDLLPPYRVQCYLTHRGIAGLIPGLIASPVVATGLAALLVLGGIAAARFLGAVP